MLDLEKLNFSERASYQTILEQYKVKQITIEDLKVQLTNLMNASIRELVEIDNNQDEKNTYLKARVKNYLLILDILTMPEIIEKQLLEVEKKLEKRVKNAF